MNDLVFQSGQTVLFIGDSITDCGRRQDQEQLGNGYVRKVPGATNTFRKRTVHMQ